jgi:hypothetical protein
MSVPECTLARLFKIAHFMVHLQLDMPRRLTAHFGKCEPHAPRGDLSLGVPVPHRRAAADTHVSKSETWGTLSHLGQPPTANSRRQSTGPTSESLWLCAAAASILALWMTSI